jgi:antiviral helicase SKI2
MFARLRSPLLASLAQWEETIIALPETCRVVCLSATVPNHIECARWIGATTRRVVYVVSTTSRPTPLRHFVYSAGQLWLLVGEDGAFRSETHGEAAKASEIARRQQQGGKGGGGKGGGGKGGGGKGGGGKGGGGKGGSASSESGAYWSKLLSTLRSLQLLPSVVFSFSKAKCDELAQGLSESFDRSTPLCTPEEAKQSNAFFEACMARLGAEERALPQITHVHSLLLTGGKSRAARKPSFAHQ